MNLKTRNFLILICIISYACANYKAKYPKNYTQNEVVIKNEISHSFYLIGDAGNASMGQTTPALEQLKKHLNQASKNSTVIFLGDNIYPVGMPKKDDPDRPLAEHRLKVQYEATEGFKGNVYFIPGNHDWYNGGVKAIKREANYLNDLANKRIFLPKDGCPIKTKNISDDISVIFVDSEWYLTNWDKHPTINNDCDIKTRVGFWDEIDHAIRKNRTKTTIIAMHHPIISDGPHNGKFSWKSANSPLPIFGLLKNSLRVTTGVSPEDIQNPRYKELSNRLKELANQNGKVIFASGHEHNLEYHKGGNWRQIVSGSGSKRTPTKQIDTGSFSYPENGFARVDIYTDGSSTVEYISAQNETLFQTKLFSAPSTEAPKNFEPVVDTFWTTIYKKEEVDRNGFYTWLWGERYASVYGTDIKVHSVMLDTLFGGVTPTKKGGGFQSKSLRLLTEDGQEYVMRAVRKQASQYLKTALFKYLSTSEDDLGGTETEDLMNYGFAGNYPFANIMINDLMDTLGIFHPHPKLYYVPRQERLGAFNDGFGNELYYIEERTTDGHGDKANFGYANKMISSQDLMLNLKENNKHVVDQESYIKARLFDMVIGDWDRHQDQWRWTIFKEDGKTVYRPVPRDRDGPFGKMGDGAVVGLVAWIAQGARKLRNYKDEVGDPRWLNHNGHAFDKDIITDLNWETWEKQIKIIQSKLTEENIDLAFQKVPEGTKDTEIIEIKRKFLKRIDDLPIYAKRYLYILKHYAIIKGTNTKDYFEIIRLDKHNTQVKVYSDKKKEKLVHDITFNAKETKEIWIYGLDDKDHYNLSGLKNNKIKIRMIGGAKNDTYVTNSGKKVWIHDYKTKENTFDDAKGKVKLTDDYEVNQYYYKNTVYNNNLVLPIIGYNPDNGVILKVSYQHQKMGFIRNPFTTQHQIDLSYFSATNGGEVQYSYEKARVLNRWNFIFETGARTPSFSYNFFGFGNNTVNPNDVDEDNFGLDFNRIKNAQITAAPGLTYRGKLGSLAKVNLQYSYHDIEKTDNRFISDFINITNSNTIFHFIGAGVSYEFKNLDDNTFPTLGFTLETAINFKKNVNNSNNFTDFNTKLSFLYPLTKNKNMCIATSFGGDFIFDDGFEFFQSAQIGGNNGLRGYRNERFSGKSAYYQQTDIRWISPSFPTILMPSRIGLYGGFDYGRVWYPNDEVDWKYSVGGGIFYNLAELLSIKVSTFTSDEGLRFALGAGFDF